MFWDATSWGDSPPKRHGNDLALLAYHQLCFQKRVCFYVCLLVCLFLFVGFLGGFLGG